MTITETARVKTREELFNQHLGHALALVKRTLAGLPQYISNSYGDDLKMIALEAMWKSSEIYEENRGIPFWTFASQRARGSILDELRKMDSQARRDRQEINRVKKRQLELSQKTGTEVGFIEACESLGLSKKDAGKIHAAVSMTFVSLDQEILGEEKDFISESVADERIERQSSIVENFEMSKELERQIERLEPMEKVILRMSFYAGVNLDHLAKQIGLTESRVCQILDKAVCTLSKRMNPKNLKSRTS